MLNQSAIGFQIISLEEVDSTNSYASKQLISPNSHGTVVIAKYQTDGKGQRGSSWESEFGKNLLASIIIKPTFLKVQKQFLLSKGIAISICDALNQFTANVSIKWPNDIYIGNNKVAGILIENSSSSSYLDSSIIGFGININQRFFSDDVPNPTSLVIETDKEHKIEKILKIICNNLDNRYNQLKKRELDDISKEYLSRLYKKDEYHTYATKDEKFSAKVFGVRDSGELILKTDKGELREFAFKEVFMG